MRFGRGWEIRECSLLAEGDYDLTLTDQLDREVDGAKCPQDLE